MAIVVACLAVYVPSIDAPFIFDDITHIERNDSIRDLTQIRDILSYRRRPVVNASLAANFAVGRLDVRGYHVLNIVVHALAGLALFGLVRRTMVLCRVAPRPSRWGACVIALIWVVHPLQTQSVTYIIQRGESMMGLFFLLSVYALLRGATSHRFGRRWCVLAVLACALGMGCKAVMVVAPIVLLLYDRQFLAGSVGQAFRTRRWMYGGLAGTWLLLVVTGVVGGVLFPKPGSPSHVGFGFAGSSAWEYLGTQAGVILHYLRLAFWPSPLCLDYGWPIARSAASIYLPGLMVVLLLVGSGWAWYRRHWLGFVGAWFFLILAPTSSFIPIKDAAFEHRMYLPLAAVVTAVVVGLMKAMGWTRSANHRAQRQARLTATRFEAVILAMAVVFVMSLAGLTIRRNQQYRHPVELWRSVVDAAPDNPRGHNALGLALYHDGLATQALRHYADAIALDPDYPEAHYNLGLAFQDLDRFEDAADQYQMALNVRPDDAHAHNNMGNTLSSLGRMDQAIEHYRRAIQLNPHFADAHNNLANAYVATGDPHSAAEHYGWVVRIDPLDVEAHLNLGSALGSSGDVEAAVIAFRRVVQLNPNHAQARFNLGVALGMLQRWNDAVEQYEAALRLTPDDIDVRSNLAQAYANVRRYEDAAAQAAILARAAAVYDEAGRRDEAIAIAEMAFAAAQAAQAEDLTRSLRIQIDAWKNR